jgi:hypothetical protein
VSIGVLAIAGLLGLLALVVREVVTREYPHWAAALARLFVRLAGRICGPRRNEWISEVLNIQRQEGDRRYSALCPAVTKRMNSRNRRPAVFMAFWDEESSWPGGSVWVSVSLQSRTFKVSIGALGKGARQGRRYGPFRSVRWSCRRY